MIGALFMLALTALCYGIAQENWHHESIRLAFRGAAGMCLLLAGLSLIYGA